MTLIVAKKKTVDNDAFAIGLDELLTPAIVAFRMRPLLLVPFSLRQPAWAPDSAYLLYSGR